MVLAVKLGSEAPLFSYQAILSSLYEADNTSRSPSLSMSAAQTPYATSAEVVMVLAVKLGSEAPSFSYQAILSSMTEADTTSRSPSLSISAAQTEWAPSAEVVMVLAVKLGSEAPSFSCQAILSSLYEADNTSRSPSLSMSAAQTERTASADVVMFAEPKVGSPKAESPFSYQATVLSFNDADIIS